MTPPASTRRGRTRRVRRPTTTAAYQPMFEPGVVIGGHYTLQQLLGEGGMGEVWVAKQTKARDSYDRAIALKERRLREAPTTRLNRYNLAWSLRRRPASRGRGRCLPKLEVRRAWLREALGKSSKSARHFSPGWGIETRVCRGRWVPGRAGGVSPLSSRPTPEVNHGRRCRASEIPFPGSVGACRPGGASRLPGARVRRRRRTPPTGRGAARRRRRGRTIRGRRRHRDVRTDLTRNPGSDRGSRRGNASAVGTGDRGRQIGRRGLHARRRPAGRSPRRIRRGPGHRRPVHAARSPRRGGDGHRLPGRSDSTGEAAGGAQADQDRHGLARGAGAVRRRAAGAGLDGPPQHRPRLRRRHAPRPASRSS